ncbi:MAG: hypothetical protein MET45_05855 [Nostoc sp. LLA-1]|nr:hypothetical protein [Cyanocohniella sp. LLY]
MHITTNLNLSKASLDTQEKMRAIAYSMDLLIPGLYVWLPGLIIRVGGSVPDDNPYKYPGKIHSSTGIAVVLPGYRIWTTYQVNYDPKQTLNTGATEV